MKIGIISDTHGDVETFKMAMDNILRDCDLIIHAGDILYHGPRNKIPKGYNPEKLSQEINSLPIDIIFAKGNCDSDVDQMMIKNFIASPYIYLYLEGFKVLVYHGHKDINKNLIKNVDIYITGHTHIYNIEVFDSTIFLNPGSLSLPKNHLNGTCAILDTTINNLSIYDIQEKNILVEFNH